VSETAPPRQRMNEKEHRETEPDGLMNVVHPRTQNDRAGVIMPNEVATSGLLNVSAPKRLVRLPSKTLRECGHRETTG
jgi:hypothetical protein